MLISPYTAIRQTRVYFELLLNIRLHLKVFGHLNLFQTCFNFWKKWNNKNMKKIQRCRSARRERRAAWARAFKNYTSFRPFMTFIHAFWVIFDTPFSHVNWFWRQLPSHFLIRDWRKSLNLEQLYLFKKKPRATMGSVFTTFVCQSSRLGNMAPLQGLFWELPRWWQ